MRIELSSQFKMPNFNHMEFHVELFVKDWIFTMTHGLVHVKFHVIRLVKDWIFHVIQVSNTWNIQRNTNTNTQKKKSYISQIFAIFGWVFGTIVAVCVISVLVRCSTVNMYHLSMLMKVKEINQGWTLKGNNMFFIFIVFGNNNTRWNVVITRSLFSSADALNYILIISNYINCGGVALLVDASDLYQFLLVKRQFT